MEETGWLSCPGGARKVRVPNPGSAAWLTTPSGARTPSRSPWIRTSRAHSSTFHAIDARARRAPALQPFPAERAAIRNRPRGEKSCITLLCQESHLTTSMDAQGSKAQRPCEFLKIFGKVPTFYGFSRLLWSRASRRDERIIQILSPQLSGTSDQPLGAILRADISPRPSTAPSTWAEYSRTLDVWRA